MFSISFISSRELLRVLINTIQWTINLIKIQHSNLAIHLSCLRRFACKIAWASFFDAFPDYQNVFETVASKDATAIIQGSDKRLEGRGIWTAKIVNDKISEWRIYLDTEENKMLLRLD